MSYSHFAVYSLADHVAQGVVFFVDGEEGRIRHFGVQLLHNSGIPKRNTVKFECCFANCVFDACSEVRCCVRCTNSTNTN